MSFDGKISGSLAPQGAKVGSVSGSIGAVVPDIRDESVTTAKLADEAVTTAKLADAAVTIAKLAQDVTALINSKGDASDVATLQSDVAALQTITDGLGAASTYGVANNITQAAAGANVLDAYQGKLLGDRMTTAEGNITTLNDGYTNLKIEAELICDTGYSVPTTETSYSCAWSGYDLLIICAVHYGNTRETIVVPVTYFSGTNSGSRPVVYDPYAKSGYDVYKNGNNAVYIKAGATDSARGVRIYGVKLAK